MTLYDHLEGSNCPQCGWENFACTRCGTVVPPWVRTDSNSPLLVPPLFEGGTVVILGDGPSITQEDVDFVRGKAHVLAINYTLRLAPWADIFYYYHEESFKEMVGDINVEQLFNEGMLVYSTNPASLAAKRPWPFVPFSGVEGLEKDARKGLRHGSNSGHAALNLCYQLGFKKIILLGFDCGEWSGYFHWWKPKRDPTKKSYDFLDWKRKYAIIAPLLAAEGVEVINCSRKSDLDCFRRAALGEVLK